MWTFVSKVISLLFNMSFLCHSFPSEEQVSFNFMDVVTIHNREWQTTPVFLPQEPHKQYDKAKMHPASPQSFRDGSVGTQVWELSKELRLCCASWTHASLNWERCCCCYKNQTGPGWLFSRDSNYRPGDSQGQWRSGTWLGFSLFDNFLR